jgi:heat shock protein HtpX
MKTHGQYTYILNNNLKSLALLAGFFFAVQLMFGAMWAFNSVADINPSFLQLLKRVTLQSIEHSPSVFVGTVVWVIIAFFTYKRMMRNLCQQQTVSRLQEPRLYNIVENVSIATGIPMPVLEVSETRAINCYALGLTPTSSTICFTRGMLDTLSNTELESVVAHEFTHIKMGDVRLMTLVAIFNSILFSIYWFVTYRFRQSLHDMMHGSLWAGMQIAAFFGIILVFPGFFLNSMIVTAIFVGAAMLVGVALRLSISHTREFVADLGAVETTKNPEALISALVKIHGRSLMPESARALQAMMIADSTNGILSTHPALETRIDTIVSYAASHLKRIVLRNPNANYDITQSDEAPKFTVKSIMGGQNWAGQALIVIPSVLSGFAFHYSTTHGLGALLTLISNLPTQLAAVWTHDPASTSMFSSGTNPKIYAKPAGEPNGMLGIFGGMNNTDVKMLTFYFLPAIVVHFLLRHFKNKSSPGSVMHGFATKFMGTSFEDDEEPQTSPDLQHRVNAAIETRLAVAGSNRASASPTQQLSGTPTFGKRARV